MADKYQRLKEQLIYEGGVENKRGSKKEKEHETCCNCFSRQTGFLLYAIQDIVIVILLIVYVIRQVFWRDQPWSSPLVVFSIMMMFGYIPAIGLFIMVKTNDSGTTRKFYTNFSILKLIVQALMLPPFFISSIDNPNIGINEAFCGQMTRQYQRLQQKQCPLWDDGGRYENNDKFDQFCKYYHDNYDHDHDEHFQEKCSGERCTGYRGKQTKTHDGLECQRWDVHTPHKHDKVTAEIYPDAGLDENYCRNPDNEQTIWCYTTSEQRYGFCKPIVDEKGLDFTGFAKEVHKESIDKLPYVQYLKEARKSISQTEVEFKRVEQCKTSIGIAQVLIFILFQVHNGYQAMNANSLQKKQENKELAAEWGNNNQDQSQEGGLGKIKFQERELQEKIKELQMLKDK